MKILLIEDDALKSERILEFIADNYPHASTSIQRSYQSGLKAAAADFYDLVLLDMTLPTFDVSPQRREGRSRTMGGRELMRKLRLKRLAPPVIVITQFGTFGEGTDAVTFDHLMGECQEELPEIFKGGVYYRASTDAWKPELKKLIASVLG